MVVRCAVELRIPDIIHSHGSPMSLSQISTRIGSPSLNIAYLSRIMRLLVHKNVFTANPNYDNPSGEILYGLTNSSRLLLHNSEMTMAPKFLTLTHSWLMEPWHKLSAAIKEGEEGFNKAYGSSLWDLVSEKPQINNLLNNGLESTTKFTTEAILTAYKDGFKGVETLVDVGGGKGYLVSEIVKANWPRIKGINFGLKHVVETAPMYRGVTHVEGDMFESVPSADAILMKTVLRGWIDEERKKILRNCREALLKMKGKLILVEILLQQEGEGIIEDEEALRFDMVMLVSCVVNGPNCWKVLVFLSANSSRFPLCNPLLKPIYAS